MISIFRGTATPAELLTNGLGTLEALFCNARETINGEFCVDISIPVGSSRSQYFKFGAIIRCSTPRGDDYFRLDVPTVTLDTLSATGWHISNDLGAPKILKATMPSKSGSGAVQAILSSCPEESRFSGTSDIPAVRSIYPVHMSPQAAIMDTSSGGCFLNIWGGEVERNKFTFNVKQRLGSDKGYRIEIGKNLLGVTETPSANGYTNRIIPRCRYAAMDQSALSALKADIDAKKTENIAIANSEKALAYAIYTQAYESHMSDYETAKQASIVAADAQFAIDGDAAKRDAAKAAAESLYTQLANVAAIDLDGNKLSADTVCSNAIAQAEQYASEAKAAADKRFSELADARMADVYLPEVYIDSTIINDWDGLKHTSHILCETVNIGEKNLDTGIVTYPTLASAYTAMRAIVAEMYANGADIPGVTIDISFVDLAQTDEYKDILALNTLDIQLGDTIHCRYHDRDISKRVVSYVWDSIGEKYLSLTLGEVALNLAKTVRNQESGMYTIDMNMRGAVQQGISYAGAKMSANDGFTSSATVGGKSVVVNMSAAGGGLNIKVDGVLVGGIILVNSVPVLVSGAMTDDPEDPECWARIGDVLIDDVVKRGLFIFRNGTTDPVFRVLCDALMSAIGDPSGHDRILIMSNGVSIKGEGIKDRAAFRDDGYTALYDANAVNLLQEPLPRIDFSSSSPTKLYSPNGEHFVSVGDDGIEMSDTESLNIWGGA